MADDEQPEPEHKHLFHIVETYSLTDRIRAKRGVCDCGASETFSVPAP